MSRPPFKLYRRQASVGTVAATGVVDHLDVVEQIAPGSSPGQLDLSPDQLLLEQLEEALGDSVVVAVSLPAYAAYDAMGLEQRMPIAPVNWLHWSECSISPGWGLHVTLPSSAPEESGRPACGPALPSRRPVDAGPEPGRDFRH